jgi:hypothetical protein
MITKFDKYKKLEVEIKKKNQFYKFEGKVN